MFADGKVERTGKAAKSGKVIKVPLFGLPLGVVLLRNNNRQGDILAMMQVFNAHGIDPARVEPPLREVEEFFGSLVKELDHAEPLLI